MPTTTTGLATSFIQFTRTSNATITDSDGKIKWAGHNLLTNSESFDASFWTRGNTSVTPNTTATTDPVGRNTADKVTVSVTSSSDKSIFNTSISTIATRYTWGVFAKAAELNWLTINAYDGSSYQTWFDLTNGVVGTNAAGSTATITAVGNGWYYCTVTRTAAAGAGSGVGYNLAPSDGVTAFTGTAGNGVYLWGAHLYRSDLGGMVLNPARGDAYYPTTPRNLLGFTEDFSNAAWVKTNILAFGSGSVANAVVAPNGLQTADLIVPNTTSGAHSASQAISSAVSGTTYIASIYVKPFGYAKFGIRENATTGAYATFNLSGAGSVIAQGSGGTGAITALSDGWYRVSMSSAAGSTSFQSTFFVLDSAYSSGAPFGYNWSGDGTSGIYLWGAQLSDSASLDAYSPVYGAAVTSAAYYAPRLDFDPVTLAARGLLVEELRANLITYSEQFDAVDWNTVNATVTANTSVAPSGQTTGDTITFGGNVADRIQNTATGLAVNGETATFSVWLKGTGTVTINVGTSTGVGGETDLLVTLTSTWTRYSVSRTYSSPTGNRRGMILIRAGNTATSVDAWGAQLEIGAFATSYMPTIASQTTRNPDLAGVSVQAFPFNASEGTIVASGTFVAPAQSGVSAMVSMSDGSSAESINIYRQNSLMQIGTIDGGAPQAGYTTTAPSNLTNAAIAYKLNDTNSAVNGTVQTADTTCTVPTVNTMDIGRMWSNAFGANGWIRQITYLPRRISNAELATRTA